MEDFCTIRDFKDPLIQEMHRDILDHRAEYSSFYGKHPLFLWVSSEIYDLFSNLPKKNNRPRLSGLCVMEDRNLEGYVFRLTGHDDPEY
jgi:hypothetical protein